MLRAANADSLMSASSPRYGLALESPEDCSRWPALQQSWSRDIFCLSGQEIGLLASIGASRKLRFHCLYPPKRPDSSHFSWKRPKVSHFHSGWTAASSRSGNDQKFSAKNAEKRL